MKRIIFVLMIFLTGVINAQEGPTGYVGYFTIKTSNEYVIDGMKLANNHIGIQFGSFFTDNWGAEVDCDYGFKNNDIYTLRLGINAIYQYIGQSDVTPYIKAGIAHKSYKISGGKTLWQGCDIKAGVGLNIPLSRSISMNLGANVSNCINDNYNSWNNTILEFEGGICFLI